MIGCYTPDRRGKSWSLKQYDLLKSSSTVRMLGGMAYGVKVRTSPQKMFRIKFTKLLQSKGKCPRMVKVIVNHNK